VDGARDEPLDPLVLVPSPGERIAGAVFVVPGVVLALAALVAIPVRFDEVGLGDVLGSGVIVALGGLFALAGRSLRVKSVVAEPAGLRVHDGFVVHELAWADVDAVIAERLDGRCLAVLHHHRYVDPLPLPSGTSSRQRAEAARLAGELERRRLAGGGPAGPPCPVRIVGGFRWRARVDVVRFDGGFEPVGLSGGPLVLVDRLLLPLTRRRATARWTAEVAASGWSPSPSSPPDTHHPEHATDA
jgi:hypothetical protein